MSRLALIVVALCAAGSAEAGPLIYRCGADGRTYSHQPCEGGKVLESSDPRSAAQRKEARAAAERERQLAAKPARPAAPAAPAAPASAPVAKAR